MTTKIEWVGNADERGETLNFITGCSRVSAGCQRCYSETMTKRLVLMGNDKYKGLLNAQNRFNGTVKFDEKTLLKPLSVKKPTTYFLSMSDLFHENVKDEWIDKFFAAAALTPHHTYQILTKRADRMRDYVRKLKNYNDVIGQFWIGDAIQDAFGKDLPGIYKVRIDKPLPNVWLGVSVENQKAADERIPYLLETPAAIRFLSCEPLLEKINIRGHILSANRPADCKCGHGHGFTRCPDTGGISKACHVLKCDCQQFRALNGIHWVIVGGESGGNARSCEVSWIRSIVKQCQNSNTPVFVKQMGAKSMLGGTRYLRIRNRKGADFAEFPEDLQVREYPK